VNRHALRRLFRIVFGLAGVTAMGFALFATWDRATETILPPWPAVVWAFVAVSLGLAGAGRSWCALFESHHAARLRAAFYAAQVGKYIPGGGVWQAIGQLEMSKTADLSALRLATAFAIHAVIQLVGGLSIGGLTCLWPGPSTGLRVLLGLGLLAPLLLNRSTLTGLLRMTARILRRDHAELEPPDSRRIVRSYLWVLAPVAGTSLAFALLLDGLSPQHSIPYAATSFAMAWALGFAAVPFPSGLGVREAVLALLLPGSTAQVLAAAIALRLVVIVCELSFGLFTVRGLRR
jgi:hypothetical protein